MHRNEDDKKEKECRKKNSRIAVCTFTTCLDIGQHDNPNLDHDSASP